MKESYGQMFAEFIHLHYLYSDGNNILRLRTYIHFHKIVIIRSSTSQLGFFCMLLVPYSDDCFTPCFSLLQRLEALYETFQGEYFFIDHGLHLTRGKHAKIWVFTIRYSVNTCTRGWTNGLTIGYFATQRGFYWALSL